MQIQLSNEEQEMFRAISPTSTGTILQGYVQKLINKIESVRTETDLTNEARIAVANILEQHLINKIKMNRGEFDKPLVGEYE